MTGPTPPRIIGRRAFLKGAGALVLGAAPLLQACSREDARKLAFLNWQDYIAPQTLSQFTRETGVAVTYQTYVSNDELEDLLLQAGRPRRGGREGTTYDQAVPSDNFVRRFKRLELIQALDRSSIPGLTNLRPDLREAAFDPGNEFTVPWATGTTGIAYDAGVLEEAPDWSVFADTRFQGQMTVLAEIRDAFAAALFSLGLDANTTSQTDIDAAADRLIEFKASSGGSTRRRTSTILPAGRWWWPTPTRRTSSWPGR